MRTRLNPRTIIIAAILALVMVPAVNYATQLNSGHPILPVVHAPPPLGASNILGITCGFGYIDNVTGATVVSRDGNGTILNHCNWAGDTDGDNPTAPLVGQDPLVSDPAPLQTGVTCTAYPCNSPPGGGGVEVGIIITNLNDTINGFDLTISYNPGVLNGVLIDQQGLAFGAPSGVLQLAKVIDNVGGTVHVAQALLGTTTGTTGGSVVLFRIRFDVVGAGYSPLLFGGSDTVTHNVGGHATPLPKYDVAGSFGTDTFFGAIVNAGAVSSYSVSFTASPQPVTPGGSVVFTAATASCTGCTLPFTYRWNFNTAEGTPVLYSTTGQTVTVTHPAQPISRVTLEVTDSSPTPNNATATQIVPFAARFTSGPPLVNGVPTVAVGSAASYSEAWIGGIPNYSGKVVFCPASSTVPPFSSCTAATSTIGSTPSQSASQTETYKYAGLYTDTLTISDSSAARSWLSGVFTATLLPTALTNVTGTPLAFTFGVNVNTTSIKIDQGVNVTTTPITYTSGYASGKEASAFIYTYYWGDGSTSTVSASGKASFAVHTYTTPGPLPGGNYTIRVTAQENSPTTAVTDILENGYLPQQIKVAPSGPTPPSVVLSCPSTGTAGTAIQCTATGSNGTTPYTFTFTATGGSPSTGTSTTNPATFSTTYNTKGTYLIKVNMTDSEVPAKFVLGTATITISPLPLADSISGPTTGTAGTAVTFTTSATGGTSPYTFSWSAPGGSPATGTGSSLTVTYNVKGTYTVNATVTDNNGAKAFKIATITVSPVALADNVSGPTTGTAGTAVTFTALATGGTSPYTFSWSAPGGTPATGTGSSFTVTYNVKGTYVVNATVTDNNGKHASKTATITINPATPVSDTVSGPTTGTVGTAVTFTASATGGTAPYTFSWSASGGSPATGTGASFTVTYNVKGTYTVNATVTDNNGAKAFKTATITISPLSLADSVSGPTTGTAGTAVTFTASATGGTAPYTFSWSAPSGSPATGTGSSFTVTYNVKGTYTVNATVTDNNGAHASKTATIAISPIALAVTVSGPSSAATGQSVTFTANPTGGTTPYTYAWSVNSTAVSGATSSSFTTTFNTAGHEVVSVTVTDNNAKTATNSITVTVSSTAITVTITCPSTGTVGTTVSCSASASGGTPPFTFSWTATGGSPSTGTGSSFSTTYSTKGSYTISVTATDSTGKTGTNSAPITISPLALTATITGGANTANPGQPLTYNANPSGGTSPYTFSWTATGATPSTGTGSSITITYSAKGTYTLSLTVKDANGVTATASLPVNITPLTLAATINGPIAATVGQTVTYTAAVSGGTTPYNYAWTINGVTNTTCGCPTLTTHFATKGSFTVGLTVTDANSKTASTSATVTVSPIALAVTVTGPASASTGQSVTYTASATGGTTPYTYAWSVNSTAVSGATSSTFTTSFNTAGHEVVSVTITDNNAKTATNSITVSVTSAAPPLAVAITCPATGTVGTAVNCTASATGGTAPYTFAWTAAGGSPGTGAGPSFSTTYNTKGSYTISVTVTDSVSKTASNSAPVTINPLALVATITCPLTGTVGTAVACTASATGGTASYTFSWTATGGSPPSGSGSSFSTTYNAKGTFTIGLMVTDSNAKTATASATITISPLALALTLSGPSSTTVGQSVTYTASVSGGTTPYSFAWSVNGTAISTATTSSFSTTFGSAGTEIVSVTVTDANAKTMSNSITVTVTAVSATHPTQTTISCSPGSVLANATTNCTAKVIDKSITPTTPTGTVSFATNSTGTFKPTTCTLTAGSGPNMASCTFSYTPTVVGQHMITGTYSGDSTHLASSGSFVLNSRAPPKGKPVFLTFTGFALDDFDNGIGQLDVLVNGQLVVNIPAGLNHLNGTGDFNPYEGAVVNFGPFDITGFLVTGQNTILFKDPTTFDHFGIVGNVLIKQDGNTILSAPRFRGVYPEFSFKYNFQFPPLTVVSFTASANNSVVTSAITNQPLTFTATYSGGTGAAVCVFSFSNDRRVEVKGLNGTCSTVVDFDAAGTFVARVVLAGTNASDLQKDSITITVV